MMKLKNQKNSGYMNNILMMYLNLRLSINASFSVTNLINYPVQINTFWKDNVSYGIITFKYKESLKLF